MAVVLSAALAAVLATPIARAEMPALSRPFTTESYERDPESLADLLDTAGMAGSVGIGYFARALKAGEGDPRLAQGDFGARGSFSVLYRRYTLLLEATQDGPLNVDSREYPSRLAFSAVWPEAYVSLQAVAGLDNDRYGGTDLALETAPLPIRVVERGANFRPELVAWLRARKFDAAEHGILNPALALSVDHLPALASAIGLTLSAHTDLSRGSAPSGFGMVQLSWMTRESPAWGEDDLPRRGVPGSSSSLQRGWYALAAYAFPLDARQYARFAIGAGARFSAPFGR